MGMRGCLFSSSGEVSVAQDRQTLSTTKEISDREALSAYETYFLKYDELDEQRQIHKFSRDEAAHPSEAAGLVKFQWKPSRQPTA
jgi:hypothetical protein